MTVIPVSNLTHSGIKMKLHPRRILRLAMAVSITPAGSAFMRDSWAAPISADGDVSAMLDYLGLLIEGGGSEEGGIKAMTAKIDRAYKKAAGGVPDAEGLLEEIARCEEVLSQARSGVSRQRALVLGLVEMKQKQARPKC